MQGGPRGHTWGSRGTTCVGLALGSPREAQGTSEGQELLALLLLLAGSGRALGLGLGTWADLTVHVPPRLGHLLSRRDGAQEQLPLHLQLWSMLMQNITSGGFPTSEL